MNVTINETTQQPRFDSLAVGSLFTENNKAIAYIKLSDTDAMKLESGTSVTFHSSERIHAVKSMSVEV